MTMAGQLDLPRVKNGFREIELLKDETLGVGSYGSVCKARCDHLLCAAKIIHQTLVSPNALQQISPQREHRLPIRRFETECDLLRDIKHPNIIQYLGMYQDPETGLPVLLMELMDESLTHFLETSTDPIPYHIQLTICLDIVQALSFLHLNGIIHRDLSSNNILLIGKGRAKLTDFGMAKLVDVRMTRRSNTICPGTNVYMPPEAIDNQAVYTEKGDVFSFGVNIIQILTRKFPKPGEQHVTIPIDDPRFPSGRIRVCVSEIERRNNHISEINTTHPLLLIALDCLKDQESERPSAGELCQRLAALKDTPEYTQSETSHQHHITELRQQLLSQQRELDELMPKSQRALTARQQEHDEQLAALKDTPEHTKSERAVEDIRTTQQTTLAKRDRQITELRQQLLSQQREHDKRMQQSQRALTARQQEIQDLREKLSAAQEKLSSAQATVSERDQIIEAKDMQLEIKEHVFESLQQQSHQAQGVIAAGQRLVQRLSEKLSTAQEELSIARATVREEEYMIISRDCQQRDHEEMTAQFQRKIEELVLNSRPQPCAQSRSPSDIARATPPTQPSRGHQPAQRPPSTSSGEGVIRLNWTQGRKAPCRIVKYTDAVVHGSVAYFNPAMTRHIYPYNSTTDTWSRLPDCRTTYTTLAIVNGLLTTVGGNNSNKLFSLTGEGKDRKWTEVFPPMSTKRELAVAVTAGRALIVAGGRDRGGLTTVEIMNTDTRQWSTAADLPQTVCTASATVCGDRIYMCERESVITCSLPALLQSCSPKIFEAQPSTPSPQGPVWSTVADLPGRRSTLVSTINNRLVAIGGLDSDDKPITAVHLYDPVNNSWQTISHLITARGWCFAVVLPNNRIMVVGGFTPQFYSELDNMEFANVVNE